jgi:UDPglucose 6-dehydrogenase
MHAREKQAENLAVYLTDLADDAGLPIVIHGKAYKPDVDYLDGSYSLLIGHYLTELGVEFSYSDPLTGDIVANETNAVVLLAHNRQITYGYTGEQSVQQLYFTPGIHSVILDPWRKFENPNYKVIHYGNTRGQV